MTEKNYIPEDYDRIKVVPDICSLLTEDFEPKANIILYPRRLQGDFDRLAFVMGAYFNLGKDEIFIKYKERDKIIEFGNKLEQEDLQNTLEIILTDMEFFHSAGARTNLRLLRNYSEQSGTHDFHVDGNNQDFDRLMVCYNNPVTQYVKNDDVISVEGHKAIVRKGAPIYAFRPGDVWRQRVRNKKPEGFFDMLKGAVENKAKRAFVHRAQKSDRPRLMLVGDMSVE
jgi:hypothetical protein